MFFEETQKSRTGRHFPGDHHAEVSRANRGWSRRKPQVGAPTPRDQTHEGCSPRKEKKRVPQVGRVTDGRDDVPTEGSAIWSANEYDKTLSSKFQTFSLGGRAMRYLAP